MPIRLTQNRRIHGKALFISRVKLPPVVVAELTKGDDPEAPFCVNRKGMNILSTDMWRERGLSYDGFHKILMNARKARGIADYDIIEEIVESVASFQIEEGWEFVATIERFF